MRKGRVGLGPVEGWGSVEVSAEIKFEPQGLLEVMVIVKSRVKYKG